jgi:hypothetical protein
MQDQNENQELVLIETYSNIMDAQLAQTTLSAAGIESSLSHDDAGGMLEGLNLTGGIKLFVNESDVEEATALLEQEAIPETDDQQSSESL